MRGRTCHRHRNYLIRRTIDPPLPRRDYFAADCVVPHQNLICGGIGGRRPVATHLASAARWRWQLAGL